MHDSLLRQRSALLLHIKFSHPQSPQHLQTAGVSAVGGQCQLHLQQTLQERVDGLRLKGFHNDVTCVRKRKALTLSAASLTEKHEDSKASSRTSISGCSASAHPSCPPALVHRAVRQPAASTYNTHTLHHNSPQTPCEHRRSLGGAGGGTAPQIRANRFCQIYEYKNIFTLSHFICIIVF